MMNLPIKLRERTGTSIPKGPTFSNTRRVRFSIEGSTIEFFAPRHRPRSRYNKATQPERRFTIKDLIFESNYDKDFVSSDSWEHALIFSRAWAFNGPWFTGLCEG